MRLGAVTSEAWRNVLSGASRTLLLVTVSTAAFLVLAWLDMATVATLDHEATTFRQAGAATIVLDAPGLVDGAACDRLSGVTGIGTAGALRESPAPLSPLVTPANSVPLYLVTPGFFRLVDAPDSGGLAVSDTVAQQFGLARGTTLRTVAGAFPVGGTYSYPDDGRLAPLQYAALAPADDADNFDACWAQIWPPDPAKWSLLHLALSDSPSQGETVTIGQLNARFGQSLSAPSQFRRRESRWAPWAAALVGLALVLGVIRLRRLELAMARHLGVSRPALTLQLITETMLWSIGVTSGTVAGIVAFTRSGDPSRAVTTPFGVAVLMAGLSGCVAGAALGGLAASQRHLFTYLKQR